MYSSRRNIFIIGIIALVIVGIAGYGAYIGFSQRNKAPLTLSAIPADATILVEGDIVKSGKHFFQPGDYRIEVQREGFKTYKERVQLTQAGETVDVALLPASVGAEAWAREHSKEYAAFEARSAQRAQAEGEAFADEHPITSKLPYENFLYNIGYQRDPADPAGKAIIITIDAEDGYRQLAVNQIAFWGYDPSTFNIVFRGYTNPFAL